MTVKSMTGFGRSECQLSSRSISIEIKALNSKSLDVNMRLPAIYREKELEIRQIIAQTLERGKIECSLSYEVLDGSGSVINKEVVKHYLSELRELAVETEIDTGDLLSTVLRFPDSIVAEKTVADDTEWSIVKETLIKALNEVNDFRISEGYSLRKDLETRISNIRKTFAEIQPFEEERLQKIRQRILQNLKEINPDTEPDPNRFEQELIYYADKLDINEEKVRLKNHLDYFMEVLDQGNPNGKKLGFICQEIGREINTLGSKANHKEIQRLVVIMKDELEKIKEQILNIL